MGRWLAAAAARAAALGRCTTGTPTCCAVAAADLPGAGRRRLAGHRRDAAVRHHPAAPPTSSPAPPWSPPRRCWTCSPARSWTGSSPLCAGAGCPVLLTLSVVGRVELTPADPLDRAWPRRSTPTSAGRRAAAACSARMPSTPPPTAFRRRGAEVLVRPSPWRLGAGEADLAAEWFTGWVGAACEQEPALAAERRRVRPPPPGARRGPAARRDRRPRRPAGLPPPRAMNRPAVAALRGQGTPDDLERCAGADAGRWARLAPPSVARRRLLWQLGAGPFLDGLRAVDGAGPAARRWAWAWSPPSCCAWRWSIVARGLGVDLPLPGAVAAYYRSQLLNHAARRVLGDVHRGVSPATTAATSASGCARSPGSAPPARPCRSC